MYILRPKYGDMTTVVLGTKVPVIQKKLRKHWEAELEDPDQCDKKTLSRINSILTKKYSSVDALASDYNKRMSY
jgi:hypothetical protein